MKGSFTNSQSTSSIEKGLPQRDCCKQLKPLIPIGISILILFVLYSNINLNTLLSSITLFHPFWAIAYVFLACFEPLIRGARWRFLLGGGAYRHILRAMYIGKACNNLFPLRMGDAVRLQYLRDKAGYPYRYVVASLVGETLIDLVFLSIISVIFAISNIQPYSIILTTAICILIAFVIILFVVFITSKCIKSRIGVLGVLYAISSQMKKMASGKRGVKAVSATAFLWLYTIATAYCGLRIMIPSVTATGILGSIVLVYFAALIPSAPGFIGSYHAAVAASIGLMGYSFADYASLPIVVHALQFIPQVIIGLILGIGYIRGNDWRKAYCDLNTARKRIMKGLE